jgi:hypothetical protein
MKNFKGEGGLELKDFWKTCYMLFVFVMLQVDQEEGGEDSILSSGEGSGRGETGGLLPPFPPPPPGPNGTTVLDH